jgi:lysophospholipase L1-like esterase
VWDAPGDPAVTGRSDLDGPVTLRSRLAPAVLAVAVVAAVVAGVVVATRPLRGPDVYVSIGDSYGSGFRPTDGGSATTRDGFAYQVADRAAAAGHAVELLNFACTGATSGEVLTRPGCPNHGLGPDADEYRGPQVDAAVAAMQEHRGRVRLVTVVIGGNDVNNCLTAAGDAFTPAANACLDGALPTLSANLGTLLGRIRSAVGPRVPVVGLTYPDVYLGGYVFGDPASRAFADGSVGLFRDRLNPALRAAYTAADASFVDVTALAGGYDPLSRTAPAPPYGTVPAPVARVCALTFYCARKDLHPTTAGHALIADAILEQVPVASL